MNTIDETAPAAVGATRRRKPSTAANLSFFLAGLGQIYCGAFRRGVVHMCVIVAIIVVVMAAMTMQFGSPLFSLVAAAVLILAATCYSAYDAHRLARRTREDYRLKEYNSLGVYLALTFVFMASVVGFAIVIRANFLQAFRMFGDSMSPAMESGDLIFVRKDAYRDSDPDRSDMVAFLNPADRRQTWVKRVVGLPGDEVEVKAGVIHINGEPLEGSTSTDPSAADVAPFTVPEHHCYLIGDHYAKSRDSRHFGTVPMIALVGKVVFVR